MHSVVNVGDLVDGKYRVDQILGSGGMSVVARAWHLELGQEVALKILRNSGTNLEESVRRFRREARVLARIKSDHVVRVFDLGTMSDGSPYIVMEYLEGNDLREELDRRGPLDVEEAAGLMLETAEALAETHAQDVVHRDLKPENLFLARNPNGTRTIKVLDFGVSKFMVPNAPADLSITKTSWFIGSPLYMSPEQMRSARSVDNRTDIWSLGAILYEMVSGRVPYMAETIPELCSMLIESTPTPIRQLRPSLPRPFAAAIERCLEKDRELRFANVAELASALGPFAKPSRSNAERVKRVVRRCTGSLSRYSPFGQAERRRLQQEQRANVATCSLAPSVVGAREAPATLSAWGRMSTAVSKHSTGTVVSLSLIALVLVLGFAFKPEFDGNFTSSNPGARRPAAASSPNSPASQALQPLPGALLARTQRAELEAMDQTSASPLASLGKPGTVVASIAPRASTPAPRTLGARRARRDLGLSPPATAATVKSSVAEARVAKTPEAKVSPPPAAKNLRSEPEAAPSDTKSRPGPGSLNPWDPSTFGGRY